MTQRMPLICVVGSAKMGEALVGHYFHMGCGGKGSNQAAMAAELGTEVTIVAKLVRDPLGEIILKN